MNLPNLRPHALVFVSISWLSTYAIAQSFDVQGHRGARGLLPENTIPAFKKALDLGVNTLELDVVISQDGQVVVSHEPFFSPVICLDPSGNEIPKNSQKKFNIYQFTYAEIQQFDCGSKGNKDFPQQQKMRVHKPLLSEVFTEMEAYGKALNRTDFAYNIEIKSSPDGDGVFHPDVATFADQVYGVIQKHIPLTRLVLQSFDFRVLRYWHEKYPDVRLAMLVANTKSVDANVQELGFTPVIYSPYYKMVVQATVQQAHAKTMQIIPWTVNEIAEMKRLKSWGVDGLITDYPDRAKAM